MLEMTASVAPAPWLTGNQQWVSLRLRLVRAALQQYAQRGHDPTGAAATDDRAALLRDCDRIAAAMPAPPALLRLAAAFGLSEFETDVLLVCAGVELDASIAAACALAHGDPARPYPTFGAALAAFPDAHWSALQSSAPLRRWRLVDFSAGGSPGAPLTTRPLRIDEQVLHLIAGLDARDERASRLLSPIEPPARLVASHEALAARVAGSWARGGPVGGPVVVLHGADAASARAVAARASRACGWQLFAIAETAIPSAQDDQAAFARIVDREARLSAMAVLVECDGGAGDPARMGAVRDWLDRLTAPTGIVSRERVLLGRRAGIAIEVGRPSSLEQRAIWTAAFADAGVPPAVEIGEIAAQFCLNASEVRAAIDEARMESAAQLTAPALWTACRHQTRGRLDDLAQRIESPASFDDLVLPEGQKDTLAEIVTHVRHRSLVYDTWGFGRRGARGLGISALFAGASGTGKTMAAEVLANALRLDLYRVDLSAVVSKYIGETEKNLRRIFDAAEAGGAVLLFDEADALFGKRSEVKDSHDRYANVEVGYLLQRMESYAGLAILTTNLKSALDTAFMRRIRFIVEFPFPDHADRARIWERAFPSATPTAGLDVARLAQLSVAGGGIKNVALGAAFLAADAREPVRMAHVLRAARAEYAKLSRPLTDAEVAGWA
jgi:hypothetical protein